MSHNSSNDIIKKAEKLLERHDDFNVNKILDISNSPLSTPTPILAATPENLTRRTDDVQIRISQESNKNPPKPKPRASDATTKSSRPSNPEMRTSEDTSHLILNAKNSENAIKKLKSDLIEALQENKQMVNTQELLTKENHKLRQEIANLHASYTQNLAEVQAELDVAKTNNNNINSQTNRSSNASTHISIQKYREDMNDIENEISQITHTNTLLRNQNDQISKEFNQMKKKYETEATKVSQSEKQIKKLEEKIFSLNKTNADLTKKIQLDTKLFAKKEEKFLSELDNLKSNYQVNKNDQNHMTELCKKMTENSAADRREIERLRIEKHRLLNSGQQQPEVVTNLPRGPGHPDHGDGPSTSEEINDFKIYMPALSKNQRDLIIDVMAAQKRALLRIKQVNTENRDLKSNLNRINHSKTMYKSKAGLLSKNRQRSSSHQVSSALNPDDNLRVWEKLENERLTTQRVISELAEREQELDNIRVERAMDKLEMYDLKKNYNLLESEIKTEAQKAEISPENPNGTDNADPREINFQTHEANRKFIEILNRKVIFLERELENAKRVQNEKHKILAKKAKTINNVSQRRKNQIMRMGLSKYKKQLDEKDQQIQRLEKVVNAMRFAEINYRKKLSLYWFWGFDCGSTFI